MRGLVGYVSWYALYLFPIFIAARNAKRIRGPTVRLLLAGLTLMATVLVVDTIPNSAGSWPHFFFAGVLHGATRGILRQDRLARLRVYWERRRIPTPPRRHGVSCKTRSPKPRFTASP
jgi:hypothetical protein